MPQHKILSKGLFSEFYADTFSDHLDDIYKSVLEDDSSSEYSTDSDNVNIQFSRSVISDSLRRHEPQHARPPYPAPTAESLSHL